MHCKQLKNSQCFKKIQSFQNLLKKLNFRLIPDTFRDRANILKPFFSAEKCCLQKWLEMDRSRHRSNKKGLIKKTILLWIRP